MIKVFTLISAFLFLLQLRAQEQVVDIGTPTPKLRIDDFAYPLFFDSEEHGSFIVNYQLADYLQAELQGFYDTNLFSNRFRSSFAFKQYFSEKFYLFTGLEIEVDLNKYLEVTPRPPRLGVISGFGYDVKNNFTLEAKSNIGLNQTSTGAFGEPFIRMPQIYTVGGKIKF